MRRDLMKLLNDGIHDIYLTGNTYIYIKLEFKPLLKCNFNLPLDVIDCIIYYNIFIMLNKYNKENILRTKIKTDIDDNKFNKNIEKIIKKKYEKNYMVKKIVNIFIEYKNRYYENKRNEIKKKIIRYKVNKLFDSLE
jgi:hypothetical protein